MEVLDFSKLKELKLLEVETTTKQKLRFTSFFIFITCSITMGVLGQYGHFFGIGICLLLFATKVTANLFSKEQFLFLSNKDSNYVEIVYKNKLQSVNAKVTYHPESNPVRIMQSESNRLYTLTNTSGSILKVI